VKFHTTMRHITRNVFIFLISLVFIFTTINPSFSIDNINYYGNDFTSEQTVYTYTLQDTSSCYTSCRFTAPATMTLERAYVYITKSTPTALTFRITLMTDNNGQPYNELGYSSLYTITTGGWQNVSFEASNQPSLTKGTIYHLVVTRSSGKGTQYFGSYHNKISMPDAEPDPAYNVLVGSAYTSADKDPAFIIEDTNGNRYGQPYTSNYDDEVYSTHYVGENLTLSSTLHIKGFKTWVKKVGSPAGDLKFCLYNMTDGAWVQNASISASSIGTSYSWVSAYFSPHIYISGNKRYLLRIESTGSVDASNCYKVARLGTDISLKNETYHGSDDYFFDDAGSSYNVARDISFLFIKNQGNEEGAQNTVYLPVNGFVNSESTDWILDGSSPYLHDLDGITNSVKYYESGTNDNNISYFNFQDYNFPSNTIFDSVVLLINWRCDYGSGGVLDSVRTFIYDGSNYALAGTDAPASADTWENATFDVSNVLTSESLINNTRLKIRRVTTDDYNDIRVTYAELQVTYHLAYWQDVEIWNGYLNGMIFHPVEMWMGNTLGMMFHLVEIFLGAVYGFIDFVAYFTKTMVWIGVINLAITPVVLAMGVKIRNAEIGAMGIVTFFLGILFLLIGT